jgi:UvrD-like helicase C-terminal domain
VEPEYPAVVFPVMTQHYAMLQRNLLYTGVTRGKRLVVLVGQKKAVAIAVRNVSGRRALVEAGGMIEHGSLEALRECMMSGLSVPAWRSRVDLASGKVENKSIASCQACRCPLYAQLLTCRCGAAHDV